MKILIVGGGVAGLTLAALLHQRGEIPIVVEQASAYGEAGYILSLYPLGNRVLHGLGLTEAYRKLSEPFNRYIINNRQGKHLRTFDMRGWMARYGEVRILTRADLLALLRCYGGGIPVKMNCTVERIEQSDRSVQVQMSDGSEHEFDLVVGADGINSKVRELLFGKVPLQHTGFMMWAWWFDPGIPHDEVQEFWGAGRLFGVYPCKDRVACVAVLPMERGEEALETRHTFVRDRLSGFGGLVQQVLARLNDVDSIDRIELADTKLPTWHRGRVLSIGDAAAAFLPSAGVGASMAMESAAVLNDELSRVTAEYVPNAIDLFIKRRRHRVDAIQAESRRVAKLMTIKSPLLATARNFAMQFMSVEQLFRDISKRMEQPI